MASARARKAEEGKRMDENATDNDPLIPRSNEDDDDSGLLSLLLRDARNDEETTTGSDDAWNILVIRLQRYANIMAHVLSLTSVIVVIVWISALGGLSWQSGKAKQVFNWHPLLMICAFLFMTVASLSFRQSFLGNRSRLKFTHGSAWSVAALCALVALIAVFKSHNDAKSGFIANLYSLHSWIGMAVIGMYLIQFFVGVVTFAWPPASMTPTRKGRILKLHKYVGPFIYNATAATILLGIQEKEGFIGCAYTVTKADVFPIQHFMDIPSVCRTSHGLGILVFGVAFCTNFALYDFGSTSLSASQHLS
jgi:cytochrome b-561